MMRKLPELNDLLKYSNQLVINRFEINHPKDAYRSDELFTDMLRYLWLCEKHDFDKNNDPDNPNLQFIPVMHEEMRAIDNMWHEFILVTREYHDFCLTYFGHYLHHEPNMRENLQHSENEFIESLTLFLNYTYDVLGEETLKLWFHEHLEEAV